MMPKTFFTGVCRLLLFATLLGHTACSQTIATQDNPTNRIDFQESITQLSRQWQTRNVAEIEIMHMPTNRHYPINISSSMLERSFAIKVTYRNPYESEFTKGLMETIVNLAASESDQVADLRWGFIIRDQEGVRIYSIYLNSTGTRGVINGACFEINADKVLRIVEGNFAHLMK
jgi:hypothetical protein